MESDIQEDYCEYDDIFLLFLTGKDCADVKSTRMEYLR